MNILALDTTTKSANVAIVSKNKSLTELNVSNEITHSEKLLPLIDEGLKKSKLSINDIGMFACLNGPGSFTGIRIGLSTLKAFSMINNKKIFAINSLEALACSKYLNNNYTTEKYIVSLINAKNDRVYYSLFNISIDSNKKIHISNCINLNNDNIQDALTVIHDYIITNNISKTDIEFCGDCIVDFKENIYALFKTELIYENTYPTPKDIINIYHNIHNPNDYFFDTYTLDAMYVRPSQAERLKNEKN